MPGESGSPASPSGGGETHAGGAEMGGNYVKLYKAQVELRSQAEHEMLHFLARDNSLVDPAWDPQQMVAASCTAFADLVADRLQRFRRPIDGFIDLSSDLPLSHANRGADLEELSEILTLDLERREVCFKGTSKRPGFVSMQVASRVPLAVRDPTAIDGGKLESERLVSTDLHVLRLDLQPGEIRHIAFNLDSVGFMRSDLAARMNALVDPERGTLASIVRTLRNKASEGAGLVAVLNDMLRDLPSKLPPAPDPTLQDAEHGSASKRLEAITAGPRKTLQRLMETMEALAVSCAPVLPCLARALDRLSLVVVREVDRLAAKCHGDYERLLSLWAGLEAERRRLTHVVERVGVGGSGEDGVDLSQRIEGLERDLNHQEQLYSNLLKEKGELHERLENSQMEIRGLRARLRDIETKHHTAESDLLLSPRTHKLALKWKSKLTTGAGVGGGESDAGSPLPTPRVIPRSTWGSSGSRDEPRELGNSRTRSHMAWTVAQSTQTDTEHVFCENTQLSDELSYAEYSSTLRMANRLIQVLTRYDWNSVANMYLLHTRGPEEDERSAPPLPGSEGKPKPDQAAARLQALKVITERVEKANHKACVAQLEEEVMRLQACANEGFEAWIIRTFRERESNIRALTEVPVDPAQLWKAVMEMVQGEGMRKRIQQLEDQMTALLPLAERTRAAHTDGSSESHFWARMMREARKATLQRKGSTVSKAQGPTGALLSGRKSAGKLLQEPTLDKPDLLREIAALWASVTNIEDRVTRGVTRVPAQEALQNCVKAFYLRKTGRSKLVESSVIQLGRSVLDHCDSNSKVALFAVMSDIQPASAIWDRLPRPRREINRDTDFKFEARNLNDLPLDSPYVMAALIRQLKVHRRQRKFFSNVGNDDGADLEAQNADAADASLALGLVLSAGISVFGSRGHASARLFELALFAFTEFPPDAVRRASLTGDGRRNSLGGSGLGASVGPSASTGAAGAGGNHGGGGDHLGDRQLEQDQNTLWGAESLQRHEVLFVSHALKAYSIEAKRQQERALAEKGASTRTGQGKRRAVVRQPSPLVDGVGGDDAPAAGAGVHEHALSSSGGGGRVEDDDEIELRMDPLQLLWRNLEKQIMLSGALGKSLESTCTATRGAELLVELGASNLPVPLLARALAACAAANARQRPEDVEIRKDSFDRLCGAWKLFGGENSAVCRESIALWAGLWALAQERSLEVELLGKLYALFDTSGDGWLQYGEFAELMCTIFPMISKAETEELFLCAAEEVTGDMTKDAFLNLVLRLGISAEVDDLETIVARRRQNLYGQRTSILGL